MPCNDGGMFRSDEDQARGLITTARDFEAVLCGILSAMITTDEVKYWLNEVDWKEVGVSRKRVEKWWKEHQKEDAERRKREEALQAKLAARESALAKLTPAERHALGL